MSKKRDEDKYGSLFGKIERPQEQHQLRGCGDPNCAQCNPETAAQGRNSQMGTYTGRFSSGGAVPRDPEDQRIVRPSGRMIFESNFGDMERRLMADLTRTINMKAGIVTGDGIPREPAKPRPSQAYNDAREEVEDWIVPAPEQSFDDIVGNSEALGMLRDAIRAPVEQKELYDAYQMKMPKGALLSGPPGCGKTMFARAAASEMKKLYGEATEFISISGSELQSMYVGQTEGYIKSIFTFAREYRAFHGHPLLVFIDEAEVILPDRTGRVRRVAPWEESQVATFLAEMDGMQESGAFVLLATNRPEVIDQAVLRDGRCEFKIVVKRPTVEAIKTILRKGFEKLPIRGAGVAELVFAAEEGFFDPHKIIKEGHMIQLKDGKLSDLGGTSFLLEHIVSGAMAASVPMRATRYAFARDKESGKPTGVNVADVVAAVNDLFEENKDLEHAFAMQEFMAEFERKVLAKKGK